MGGRTGLGNSKKGCSGKVSPVEKKIPPVKPRRQNVKGVDPGQAKRLTEINICVKAQRVVK